MYVHIYIYIIFVQYASNTYNIVIIITIRATSEYLPTYYQLYTFPLYAVRAHTKPALCANKRNIRYPDLSFRPLVTTFRQWLFNFFFLSIKFLQIYVRVQEMYGTVAIAVHKSAINSNAFSFFLRVM